VQNLSSSRLKNLIKTLKKNIILPAVLYGCETWFLTLREEQRLRVFENRLLRRIFGPKREKWQEAEEDYKMRSFITCTLHQMFRVIDSRRMEWVGHVARVGEERNAYKILVRKPEGTRSLGRTRSRWKNNIRMTLRVVGWEVVDWVYMAQDRDQWPARVNTVMNLRVP
jgi:hypothetical protein